MARKTNRATTPSVYPDTPVVTRKATPKPKSSSSITTLLLSLGALLAAFVLVAVPWLERIKSNHYVFDHDKIYEMTSRVVAKHGNSTEAMFDAILEELHADPKIGPTLNPNPWRNEHEWVFNNAGGAMGSMYIIHASVTEYLIFFGTPLGTEGHTGRHTADDYFNILWGEERAYKAGAVEPEVYPAGSVHHLQRGTVKQYMMPETGCWALELAQGWVPPMLPFGFADVISSTLDFPSFFWTSVITAREMFRNLLQGKV